MIKTYTIYLIRWQASTLILAPVIWLMADYSSWVAAAVANLIGGAIFFWVDRLIFKEADQTDKLAELLAKVDEETEACRIPVEKMGMLRIRKIIAEEREKGK